MIAPTAKAPRTKKRPPVRNSAAPTGDRVPLANTVLEHSVVLVEPAWRQAQIARCAYYRAERRGFAPGHTLEDWYAAEREIDAMLARGETPCGS